jgi:hypothetical protein
VRSRPAQHRARRGCRRQVYYKRRCSAARRGRPTPPTAITVIVATIPAPAHFVDQPAVFPRRPARDASLHRVVLVAAGACERGRLRRAGALCEARQGGAGRGGAGGAGGADFQCRWWGNAPSGAYSRLLGEVPVVLDGRRRHRHPEVANEPLARDARRPDADPKRAAPPSPSVLLFLVRHPSKHREAPAPDHRLVGGHVSVRGRREVVRHGEGAHLPEGRATWAATLPATTREAGSLVSPCSHYALSEG